MEVKELSLNKIKLGENSRMHITKESVSGLMQSIKEIGLLQPVGVIENSPGAYELTYGNRRFLACSKLGWTKMPCVIIPKNGAGTRDIKNLTENVQRSNLSLIEAGRFITLLKKQGLGQDEIAVRMGVTSGYVKSCLGAFQDVPAAHRDDIQLLSPNERAAPGKVSLTTANKIMNAEKTYRLSNQDVGLLFKAAKIEKEQFNDKAIGDYAKAIKNGHRKDFLTKVKPAVAMRLEFMITSAHAEELREKYIKNGPFKSLTQLMLAVLKGEKAIKIKMA